MPLWKTLRRRKRRESAVDGGLATLDYRGMAETDLVGKLDEACQAVRARAQRAPHVGLVLGSGLGAFADQMSDATRIDYNEIPHMPTTAVVGHAGRLCLGEVAGTSLAVLQGRAHAYEGHAFDSIAFGVRMLARLGCFAVLITNAAGGINHSFKPGTLMLISDHINLMGRSPLVGPNVEALGPRFPDMTRPYDQRLSKLAREAAQDIGLPLEEGVYAGMLGPAYETPAEIHMLRTIGADAVGMSTVPEVIALRHMGVRAAAVSCITNMAAGLGSGLLDHSEVEATAAATRDVFVKLLTSWVGRIGSEDWDQPTQRRVPT
jgi:purine-nucleoside phosphorylase